MEKLLLALGCAEGDWVPVGGMATVEIRDNINPQGGGDYLTDDEVMCGYRANFCHALNAGIVILMNAGVDASTLKHVQNLDDGKAVMVLLNCGVDRISWFAKRSFASYINQYVAAYYLKAVVGCGWFFKQSPWPWATYVETSSGLKLLSNAERRPKFVDVQADVNIAVALM